jgi:hypothetical protein
MNPVTDCLPMHPYLRRTYQPAAMPRITTLGSVCAHNEALPASVLAAGGSTVPDRVKRKCP